MPIHGTKSIRNNATRSAPGAIHCTTSGLNQIENVIGPPGGDGGGVPVMEEAGALDEGAAGPDAGAEPVIGLVGPGAGASDWTG